MNGRSLFHGTAAADAIERNGFLPSSSGGGQRGLRGVWLSPDRDVAARYASNAARYRLADGGVDAGPAELFEVRVPATLRLYDLRGTGRAVEAWVRLGILDLASDRAHPGWAYVRELNASTGGYGLTAELLDRGYDGAVIDSTTDRDGPAEVVVFDPLRVEVLRRTPA